jgi:hypothetical protein
MDKLGSGITAFVSRLAGGWADSPDSWTGLATSALAGAAAALAIGIALTLYFRSRMRSGRDLVIHGSAAIAVLGLLGFVAYDMRQSAFDYLGINPSKPAVEFEIRLPPAVALAAIADTQVELHTDRNQTIARVQNTPLPGGDGSILRGSVPLDFRTTDRVVILNLPGQAQHLFKLRLAANPSRSAAFGPWHLADRVHPPATAAPDDAYAIRYRVM